jgi:hypothetical protein
MFDRFFEMVNEPVRSDIGHNAKVLGLFWFAYISLFLALLLRDFFAVRHKVLLGQSLDDREMLDLSLSVTMSKIFVASGALLNLYQVQFIMFHNSSSWTSFCTVLFLLELCLICFDIYRIKCLSRFMQNERFSLIGSRWVSVSAAVGMVALPLFGAFMALAQYSYDQQFYGC